MKSIKELIEEENHRYTLMKLKMAQNYYEKQIKEKDKEIEGLRKVIQYWESIIKAELSPNIQKFVKEAKERFNISEEDEDKKAWESGEGSP